MRDFVRRLTRALNFGMDRITPDSFVFAIALTVIVFFMGVFMTGKTPFNMLLYWAKGFWGLLAFASQIVLCIAAGYAFATSPVGQRGIIAIAKIPKTALSGTIFLFLSCVIFSWFSWSLGLIGGGLLARALGKNLKRVDFKLMVAAAFSGVMVGNMGLSWAEALLVNTPGHFLEKEIGIIPFSQTALSAMVQVPLWISALILPFFYWAVHPDEKDIPMLDEKILAKFEIQDNEELNHTQKASANMSFAEMVDNSPIVNILISIPGLAYMFYWFYTQGFNLTFDIFIWILLFLGILFHWTPASFLQSFEIGVKNSFGVVLQFPFYAGIQGMMASSGLVVLLANWFVSVSTPATFPVWTYLSAALINLFVPSSGGIFATQGPVMIKAGAALGIPAATVVNTFASGEVISNMIQPFWAIPLLSLVGLKISDIIGYCLVSFAIVSVVFCSCFYFMA